MFSLNSIRSDRYPFLIDTPRFADTGNTIITIKFRKDIFRECRTDSINRHFAALDWWT